MLGQSLPIPGPEVVEAKEADIRFPDPPHTAARRAPTLLEAHRTYKVKRACWG